MVAGRLDRRHVAVLQVDHLAGVADEGGDVGRGEHLVLAQAEHQRGAVAGDDELVGVLGVHHHEAVGALDPLEGADDRVLEGGGLVGRELGRDHVRERLGVGVAGELRRRWPGAGRGAARRSR